jgi:hypothetical protein
MGKPKKDKKRVLPLDNAFNALQRKSTLSEEDKDNIFNLRNSLSSVNIRGDLSGRFRIPEEIQRRFDRRVGLEFEDLKPDELANLRRKSDLLRELFQKNQKTGISHKLVAQPNGGFLIEPIIDPEGVPKRISVPSFEPKRIDKFGGGREIRTRGRPTELNQERFKTQLLAPRRAEAPLERPRLGSIPFENTRFSSPDIEPELNLATGPAIDERVERLRKLEALKANVPSFVVPETLADRATKGGRDVQETNDFLLNLRRRLGLI